MATVNNTPASSSNLVVILNFLKKEKRPDNPSYLFSNRSVSSFISRAVQHHLTLYFLLLSLAQYEYSE
jgi:hypothetical protein